MTTIRSLTPDELHARKGIRSTELMAGSTVQRTDIIAQSIIPNELQSPSIGQLSIAAQNQQRAIQPELNDEDKKLVKNWADRIAQQLVKNPDKGVTGTLVEPGKFAIAIKIGSREGLESVDAKNIFSVSHFKINKAIFGDYVIQGYLPSNNEKFLEEFLVEIARKWKAYRVGGLPLPKESLPQQLPVSSPSRDQVAAVAETSLARKDLAKNEQVAPKNGHNPLNEQMSITLIKDSVIDNLKSLKDGEFKRNELSLDLSKPSVVIQVRSFNAPQKIEKIERLFSVNGSTSQGEYTISCDLSHSYIATCVDDHMTAIAKQEAKQALNSAREALTAFIPEDEETLSVKSQASVETQAQAEAKKALFLKTQEEIKEEQKIKGDLGFDQVPPETGNSSNLKVEISVQPVAVSTESTSLHSKPKKKSFNFFDWLFSCFKSRK